MAVLLPGKFLYLATPRTGSSATAEALKTIGGRSVYGRQHMGLAEVKAYEGEHVFTAIRNPYDVLASWYVRIHRTDGFRTSFVEFLRSHEHEDFTQGDPPTLFYHCHEGVEVLRWEALARGINDLLATLGLPSVVLPRDNVTPKKRPWPEYYDEATIEAVHDRFGHDLDGWGYPRLS